MAKENAIIKELAVESLGCVSVICSDKTGTLTQNKMTVQQVYIDGKVIAPKELNMDIKLHRNLLFNAILTNDATIMDGKGIGDPTEYSLIEMTRKLGLNEEYIRGNMLRLAEIPFDSDRKLMSTKYVVDDDAIIMTKGALDVLLDRTVSILTNEGVRPITDADKESILATNMQFSENGLRVLAFAYKETEVDNVLDISDEYDYTFTGLISMMDPPRVESTAAVADAKRAGIFSVLYTSIMGLSVPFAPVHLLFMNLLTDSLPAIAIGMEPPEDGLLNKAPRNPKEGILTKEFIVKIGGMGALIAICTMAAFHMGLNQGDEMLASTMAFATLTLARLFHGFNCRSDMDIFKLGFKRNIASLTAFLVGIVFLTMVLFVPILSRLFAVSTLTGGQLGAIVILALIPPIITQYGKIKNCDTGTEK